MDRAFLHAQALKLRRLARGINDEAGRTALMAMAEECEAKAAQNAAVATIRYEVSPSGPKGFQVKAVDPDGQDFPVWDFSSGDAAGEFADAMRKVDAAAPLRSGRG